MSRHPSWFTLVTLSAIVSMLASPLAALAAPPPAGTSSFTGVGKEPSPAASVAPAPLPLPGREVSEASLRPRARVESPSFAGVPPGFPPAINPVARVRWNAPSGGGYDAFYVAGYFPTGSVPDTVELLDAGLTHVDWAMMITSWGGGQYSAGFITAIEDGYTVRVSGGGVTQDVTVEPLSASVDVDADTVGGTFAGLPNAPVEVEAGGNVLELTTDGTGFFQADFGGIYDLGLGDVATVNYTNAKGDQVYYQRQGAVVRVRYDNGYDDYGVDGYWPLGAYLTVQLQRAPGVVDTDYVGWVGAGSRYSASFVDPITDTAVVTVSGGGLEQVVTVGPLTDLDLESYDEEVSGVFAGLPNHSVNVAWQGVITQVNTDGGGAFTADFLGQGDVAVGDALDSSTRSYIYYADADHNLVYYSSRGRAYGVRVRWNGPTTGYNDDYVDGYLPTATAPVTITRATDGATIYDTALDLDGRFEYWFASAIVDSNTVTATDGATTRTIGTPVVNALGNYADETVSGTALDATGTPLAGERLRVYVNGYERDATVQADGTWSVSFAGVTNFSSSTTGWVRYTEADGDEVYYYLRMEYTRFYLYNISSPDVSGYFPIPNHQVSITLWSGAGAFVNGGLYTTSSSGYYYLYAGGLRTYIAEGDVVRVVGNSPETAHVTRVYTVPAVFNAVGDATADSVSGQVSAATNITQASSSVYPNVYVSLNGISEYATTDVTGSFVVTETISPDLRRGNDGYLRYYDANGNRFERNITVPGFGPTTLDSLSYPRIGGSTAYGYFPRSGVPITLTLRSVTGTLKSLRTDDVSSYDNYFTVSFTRTVQEGDLIEAADRDGVQMSLRVPTMTLTLDQGTDLVSGTIIDPAGGVEVGNTDAGKYPWLYVYSTLAGRTIGVSGYVTATTSGAFSFDPQGDIQAGDWGYVQYTDLDGDFVNYYYAYSSAYGIRVEQGTTDSRGQGFAPTTIITVTQSDDPGQRANANTDADGYYDEFGYTFNSFTNNFDPGDTITVTDGTTTHAVTVPVLNIRAYAGGDRIYGSGLNSRLEIALSGEGAHREVTDLGGGNWELDLSEVYNFNIEEYVYYRYSDDNGNQVHLDSNNVMLRVGNTVDSSQVRWWQSGWGGWDAWTVHGFLPGYTTTVPTAVTGTLHTASGALRAQVVAFSLAAGGYYNTDLFPVTIQDGDFITVTDGTTTIRLDVPIYTVDSLDYGLDTVSGRMAFTDGVNPVQATGIVTSNLFRAINENNSADWADSAFFASDAAGAYDAVLSGGPGGIDLGDEDAIRYLYVNGDANEVYFDTTSVLTASGNIRWDGSDLDRDRVRGYWLRPNVTLDIDLYDASGGIKDDNSDLVDANRWFEDYLNWNIEGGDTIVFSEGGDSLRLAIADVQVDVDIEADDVLLSGLPANQDVEVALYSTLLSDWIVFDAVCDGAGDVTVDLSGAADIVAGDYGHVAYQAHPTGFFIYTRFDVPFLGVYAHDNGAMADVGDPGGAGTLTVDYTLRLLDGGGMEKAAETGSTSGATTGSFDDLILPGDTVELAVAYPTGDQTVSVEVPPELDVTGVDWRNDVITVTAPAGVTGTAMTELPWLYLDVSAGQWLTSSTSTYVGDSFGDISRTGSGLVWYNDAQGHQVYLSFNSPYVALYANAGWNDIDGQTLLPDRVITVTVTDSDGGLKAQAVDRSGGGGGLAFNLEDTYGYDVKLAPEDTVEIAVEEEGIKTFVIPTVTSVADFADDTVTGQISSPDIAHPVTGSSDEDLPSLYVEMAAGGFVSTTVSGSFVATQIQVGDFSAGDGGAIAYYTTAGDEIWSYLQAPYLQARWDGSRFDANQVHGYVPVDGAGVTVTLQLLDSDGSLREVAHFFDDGFFSQEFDDLYGNDVNIENGDSVVMMAAGYVYTVPVPATFYVAGDHWANAVSGQITGTGVMNPLTDTATVTDSLYLNGFNGPNDYVATDVDGSFSVELDDFGPTDNGTVRYRNADGNEVYQRALTPWVMIHLGGSRVDGSVVRPNVPVHVTLYDDSMVVKDTEQSISDGDGMFAIEFTDDLGNGITIEGGDQVVIVASPPITVDVPTIEVYADATTDVVSGTITVSVTQNLPGVVPNLYIKLDVGSGLYRWVTTTTSSPYTFVYDFGGEYDLSGGDTGEVRYTDGDGHQVYVNFEVPEPPPPGPFTPELTLRDGGDARVEGRAVYGNQDVDLMLYDGGTGVLKGAAGDTADGAGYFGGALNFLNAANNAVNIADGDRVEMMSLDTNVVYTVPVMSDLGANPATDEVSGTLTGLGVDNPLALTVTPIVGAGFTSTITGFNWIDIAAPGNDLGLDDDNVATWFPMPFSFDLYGVASSLIWVTSNGMLNVGTGWSPPPAANRPIPRTAVPNSCIAPFWDDQTVYAAQGEHVYAATFGTAPNRYAVFQWQTRDVGATSVIPIYEYQVILYENGNILFQYNDMGGWPAGDGRSATVGLENFGGTYGLQYSYNAAAISDGLAILFVPATTDIFDTQSTPTLADRLEVQVNGSEYVTTTAGGDFSTLNGLYPNDVENVGFNVGDSGWVRYEDRVVSGPTLVELHEVYYNFVVPELADVLQMYIRWSLGAPESISGWVAWPDEPLELTLRDAGGALKSQIAGTSNANAYYNVSFTDAAGNGVPVLDGDVIALTSRDSDMVITVPVHSIALDPINDLITGTLTGALASNPITCAPAITEDELRINIGWTEHLSTTSGGDFGTANQSFDAGDTGWLALRDSTTGPQGELAQVRRIAYWFNAPYSDFAFDALRVHGHNTYALALANYGDQPITFRLYDGTTLLDEQHESSSLLWSGSSYAYEADFDQPIEPGHRIEVSYDADPSVVRSFTVPELMVTDVDTLNDTVAGTAGFTEPLAVNWAGWLVWGDWTFGTGTTRVVSPTAGTWSTSFLGFEDIGPGEMDGHLLYTDGDGDQLYQQYAAQQIVVYKDQKRVEGPVYNGGVTVTLSLLDGGGAVKHNKTFQADGDGWFGLDLEDIYDNPIWIHAGDRVVIEASSPVTIAVPELSAWADWYDETVVGESSLISETINVKVEGTDLSVDTDVNGDYVADFTGISDLEPGDRGGVAYEDGNGNLVMLGFYVPVVYVRWSGQFGMYDDNLISGWTAAGTEVTVTMALADGGSGEVKSTAMTTWGTGGNGWYAKRLVDAYGNGTPILAGDVITITETAAMGVRQQVFTVPPMTADTDVLIDTVNGQMTSDAGISFEVGVGERYSGQSIQTLGDLDDTYAYGSLLRRISVYAYTSDNDSLNATVTAYNTGTSLWDILYSGSGGTRLLLDQPYSPAIYSQVRVQLDDTEGNDTIYYDYVFELGSRQTVTTTAGGAYTANFAPDYDIQNGDQVRLVYADTDNGRWFTYQNRAPVVLVRWKESTAKYDAQTVSGYTNSRTWVVLTLWRGGVPVGSRSGLADSTGRYELVPQDSTGNNVTIEDGDVIQVQTVEGSTSVSVVGVTFDSDVDNQIVSGDGGTGLAGTEFEVCFGTTCRTALVDGSGHYTATFPTGTFTRGQYGQADQLNGDHNQVHYLFYVPVSELFVRIVEGPYTDDGPFGWNVGGMVPFASAPVTVTLSAGGVIKSKALVTSQVDREFGARLEDSYGDPIVVQPDDTVQVESTGMSPLVVTVPSMHVEGDANADQVSGYVDGVDVSQTGLVTDSVLVNRSDVFVMDAGRLFVPGNTQAVTATSGLFETTMTPLLGGDRLNLVYIDTDGNEFYTRGEAIETDVAERSVVRAWVGENHVGGLSAFTDELITVTLESGSGGVKSIYAGSAGGHAFGPWSLEDAAGNDAIIEPGDILYVELGTADSTITLPVVDPFTLEASADSDGITGELGSLDITNTVFITASLIINVGASGVDWDDLPAASPLIGGTDQAISVTAGAYSTVWDGLGNGDDVWALYTNDAGNQLFRDAEASEAPTLGQAWLTVYPREDSVDVVHPQPGQLVTVTLWSGGYQVARGVDWGSSSPQSVALVDVYGNPVVVRAGDVVEATFYTDLGIRTYFLTVPAMSALASPLDETVSGQAPAGMDLEVEINGVERTVTPDPGYSQDFTGLTDIDPGDDGSLYLIITDTAEIGIDVWMDFYAPQVIAYKGTNEFMGYSAFSSGSGTPVTATLYRSGQVVGTVAFMSDGSYGMQTLCDPYGNCNVDHGNAASMRPGDELVVTARGEPEIRVTIPELTAWADANGDVVSGDSNLPDVDLEVEINGIAQTVRTSGTGDYQARFDVPPFVTDIRHGNDGYVRYLTPDGQIVQLDFRAPFLRAYLGENRATVWVATQFNVTATLELHRGVFVFQEAFNASGEVAVRFYDQYGNPVIIESGDILVLEVPDDDAITLEVPDITVTPDPVADQVTVVGPAGIQSTVGPSPTLFLEFQGRDIALTSDSDTYVTVFDDVNPGDGGAVIYTNSDGDEVVVSFITPIVRVHASSDDVGGNAVTGYALANRLVALALRRGTATLWSGAEVSTGSGAFTFTLPVAIQSGDVVEVQGGGLDASVDVVALDATVDHEDEQVAGSGPSDIAQTGSPTHTLWVNSNDDPFIDFDNGANEYVDGATRVVTTTASGAFSVDFSDVVGDADSGGDYGEVRYVNPDGHQIYAQFVSPYVPVEPEIHIWQYLPAGGNVIWGVAGERNAVVWVTLYAPNGMTQRATWRGSSDGAGNFWVAPGDLRDAYGQMVRIRAGDKVEVKTLDWSSGPITVEPLSAMADIATDVVAGTGPANITNLGGTETLVVQIGGTFELAVTTDGAGDFWADFGAAFGISIDRGDGGVLSYTDANGNVIYRQFYAPGLRIYKDTDKVRGIVGMPEITVTVSLVRASSPEGWRTGLADAVGSFDFDLKDGTGAPVLIREGDQVVVRTDLDEAYTVTVPALSVSANADTEIIGGDGPADGERLWIELNGAWIGDATVYGGTYEADFTGQADVHAQDYVEVGYQDAEGHWFYASSGVPGIAAVLYGNGVSGRVTESLASIDYRLRSSTGVIKGFGTTRATREGGFDGTFLDEYGNPATIWPGDQIVIDTGSPIVYTVPDLTGVLNVDEDRVSGVGPAGVPVDVCAGYCQTVWTDPTTGAYAADFTGRTNILPGTSGSVLYTDADGNRYSTSFVAPNINVEYQGNPLKGSYVYGNPSAVLTYTVELERDGRVIARAFGQGAAGAGGGFGGGGRDVMLVIDRSGSMGGQPIEDAKAAAKGFVSLLRLPPEQVGLVSFSSSAALDQQLTTNVTSITQAIDGLVAGGGTDIGVAIALAHQELTSTRHIPSNVPTIILLSDGYGGDPVPAADAAKAEGIRVIVIGLGAGVNEALLQAVASSPSDYYYAPTSEELADIFGLISGGGRFSFYLSDLFYDNPLLTADDDVLILKEGGIETGRVRVVELSAIVDVFADTIAGTGPPNAYVRVIASDGSQSILPDTFGNYIATNPFYQENAEVHQDFVAGSTGQLIYRESDGDLVFYNFTAPYLEVWASFQPGLGSINGRDYGYVEGIGWPEDRPVVLTLYDSGSTVKDTETRLGAGFGGWSFFVDVYGNPVEIAPGDRVVAQASGVPSMEVVVPQVNDLVVDTDADLVSGTLAGTVASLPVHPSGSLTHTLNLYVNGTNINGRAIDTTVGGAFEHVYGHEVPPLDIIPGSMGSFQYVDLNGNRARLRFEAPRADWTEPFVELWEYGTRVQGTVLLPRVPVTVTLYRGGTARASESGLSAVDGLFQIDFEDDLYGNDVPIMPGDQVVIEAQGAPSIPVFVEPMSATPDPADDVIVGTGPDTGELEVEIANTWLSVDVAGGAWTADYRANNVDFDAGDAGQLRYTNPDGHIIHLDFRVPMARAFLYTNFVEGQALHPNTLVTATLTNGVGNVKAQAVVASNMAGGNGRFEIQFVDRFGQPVEMWPGDVVTVYPHGAVPRILDMIVLDGRANPHTEVVAGQAPANARVQVSILDNGGNALASLSPLASGTGDFDASFAGLVDILAGTGGNIVYLLSETGDEEVFNFAAPVVWVREGAGNDEGLVHGLADRMGRNVYVEVSRPGSGVVATGFGEGGLGFDVTVRDVYGSVVPILPGDTVNVTFGSGTPIPVNVPAAALDATVDVDDDTVTVVGPTDEYVEVDLGVDFPNNSVGRWRTLFLGVSGQAAVDYGGYYDIPSGVTGYVHYLNEDGNSVYVNFADPVITVHAYDTFVSGWVAATAGLARVELVRGGDVIAAGSGQIAADGRIGGWMWTGPGPWDQGWGIMLRDEYGLATVIEPGDTVVVEVDGVDMATIPVGTLAAGVDVANDVVTLVGPAGQDVEIDFMANPGGILPLDRTVVATGSPLAVDYGDGVDPTQDVLRSGAAGVVRYHTADGHWVQANFSAPIIRLYEGTNGVDGNAGAPRASVEATLRRGAAAIATASTEADAAGDFAVIFVDATGEPLNIASDGNDTVEVSINGGAAIDVPAVALSAVVDVVDDAVSGNAGTGGLPILVTLNGVGLTVPGGTYSADFRGRTDIQAGDGGEIKFINGDGNEVYLAFAAPIVRVNLGDDYVDGFVSQPGDSVEVTLLDGTVMVASERTTADPANGWFGVNLRDARAEQVIIQSGQTVEVRADGALVATIQVPTLTAEADPANDTVSGDAPDGEVRVTVDGMRQTVIAASPQLTYGADFSSLTDIRAWPDNSQGEVRVSDRSGNEIYREFATPVIRAELRGSHVEGWTGYENVTVTVQATGAAPQEVWVGFFDWEVELHDIAGAAYYLQPGDTVNVTTSAGAGSGTVTIVDIDAEVNAADDTVAGTAPTSGQVLVTLDPPEGRSLTADAGPGGYAADFRSMVDIVAGTAAEVASLDAGGHYVYLRTSAWHVRVKVYDNLVWGFTRHDVEVRVDLRRGSVIVATAYGFSDTTGRYQARLLDDYDEPVQILPGDRVEVIVESQTVTVDVVELTATPDVAADTVSGATTVSNGEQINVILDGCQKTVLASGGSYSAANPFYTDDHGVCGLQDVAPGTDGEVRHINGDGNWVYRHFVAPILEVQMAGSQTGPEVWGFTNAPGELVTVTIDHASSTYRGYGRSRLEDSFFHIDVGLTIVASDTVTAQWAGGSRSLTVPDLSATVNPETGHVGGRAPAGARVEVRGWGVETAADDNTYSIWAGVSMAGAQRDVMITDLDSLDRVWLRAVAPIVYIHRGHDEVWGYARFADANVEVTIVPASHIPQPQLVNTTSDRGSGYFYVQTGSALVSGDVVQVMVGDEVDEVTVVDLGAAADAAAEVVSGVGPVGAELHVSVPEGRRTVVADGSGAFTADFANQHLPGDWTWPINIRPGDVGDVQYVDANGNVIYARFNAPLLRAHVTNDTVKGYATPGFSIVVTLRDSSGALKSAASTISDETGRYFVHFESEDIVAGDAISVEVGGASQFAMTVDDLAAAIDTATDQVTGFGPSDSRVSVAVYQADMRQGDGEGGSEAAWRLTQLIGRQTAVLGATPRWTTPLGRVVPTAVNGSFTADFRGQADLGGDDYAYLHTGDYDAEIQTAIVLDGSASALLGELQLFSLSYSPPDGLVVVKRQVVGTIDEGEMVMFTHPVTRETGLVMGLNWTNQFRGVDDAGFWAFDGWWLSTVDQLELRVYRPDGELHAISRGSGALAPLPVLVWPRASIGTWRFEVYGLEVPYDNMQFAATVAEIVVPETRLYLPLILRNAGS